MHGSTVLHVDTTFEITDNLWLTHTCFTNESFIDKNKNHPELPGSYMVHFRKDCETYQQFVAQLAEQQLNCETYQQFVAQLAAAEPSLLKVKLELF